MMKAGPSKGTGSQPLTKPLRVAPASWAMRKPAAASQQAILRAQKTCNRPQASQARLRAVDPVRRTE